MATSSVRDVTISTIVISWILHHEGTLLIFRWLSGVLEITIDKPKFIRFVVVVLLKINISLVTLWFVIRVYITPEDSSTKQSETLKTFYNTINLSIHLNFHYTVIHYCAVNCMVYWLQIIESSAVMTQFSPANLAFILFPCKRTDQVHRLCLTILQC